MGAWAPPGSFFFFFQLLYISFLQLGPPSKTLGSLSLNKPNQPQLNSNYPTQKLNKNNKNIHNDDYILAKKKTILPPKNKKIMCIGESKAKFFPITVNKYKYQLTIPVNCSKLLKIKYNILLRLYLFLQLKNLNSLASFIILMSCLYYFR